ncbi:peptidase S28 [Corynespora cassiicola Philippines]|uniref:Peptidase S28 n=1 Tax=Corynespora cassiicola Philippines TaxID=1448308 RepID=A0A2T2NI38_CORCC|nr:peptidase S28 [Corynespora cassiicola Philippines]
MRAPASKVLAGLALAHAASAYNAWQNKFSNLADMGLLPDGTPMEGLPQVDELLSSMRITAGSSKTAAAAAAVAPAKPETIVAEYVELPLDNFAENGDYDYHGTFNNRFWVAESGYRPGGPVFLYDVGEADAEPNALFRLQNETSFFKQAVDQFGGIGIVWEHRYYGNSTPELITTDTPPEVFRWLNTEQSLADVDRFAKQFSRRNINYTLTPDKTPWIFVGGSYPAMRAAFMRDQYPDTIYAAYASSAPTEARVDMSVYFEPIWQGLNRYGFGNCTRDVQAAVRYIDDRFDRSASEAAKIKEQFLGLGAANNSHAGFADALTTVFYVWQSYGVEGGTYGLRQFCDFLEKDPKTNQTAGADGWAKSKGVEWTVARWAAYPNFLNNVNEFLETNCSGNMTTVGDCNLSQQFTDAASISWTWQYCTQWGYFQSANLGPHQIVSKYNSLTHQKDVCHRQFPTAPSYLLPDWPQTDRTNEIFGGWDLRPSNTYWSGGEFDPWRTLSPLSDQPGSPKPRTFTNAPKCGEEQDEGSIFGYTIPEAQHCYDFRTSFAPGAVSRKYFVDALTSWLKCFKPKKD